MQPETFYCADCHQTKPVKTDGGTGYGEWNGDKVCYDCCAIRDRKDMTETGRAVLYLSKANEKDTAPNGFNGSKGVSRWVVTNWPGTLRFNAYVKTGRHNIGRTRCDAWFTGPDGKQWHGVQIGEWSQICRCKRLKN